MAITNCLYSWRLLLTLMWASLLLALLTIEGCSKALSTRCAPNIVSCADLSGLPPCS
jgi:hypothetical protein